MKRDMHFLGILRGFMQSGRCADGEIAGEAWGFSGVW